MDLKFFRKGNNKFSGGYLLEKSGRFYAIPISAFKAQMSMGSEKISQFQSFFKVITFLQKKPKDKQFKSQKPQEPTSKTFFGLLSWKKKQSPVGEEKPSIDDKEVEEETSTDTSSDAEFQPYDDCFEAIHKYSSVQGVVDALDSLNDSHYLIFEPPKKKNPCKPDKKIVEISLIIFVCKPLGRVDPREEFDVGSAIDSADELEEWQQLKEEIAMLKQQLKNKEENAKKEGLAWFSQYVVSKFGLHDIAFEELIGKKFQDADAVELFRKTLCDNNLGSMECMQFLLLHNIKSGERLMGLDQKARDDILKECPDELEKFLKEKKN